MTQWLSSLPVQVAYAVLLVVVFCRAQATYWLARSARNGFARTRLGAHLDGPRLTRATDLLRRRGLILIPLSFLTIGFQTLVNASAGLLQITWPRYTLAMLPGCAAWALIYATIGMAAFEAWLLLAARSPWAAVALLVLIVTALLCWRLRKVRDDAAV